ncbi:beta strand repeat-containing protein [Dokdonella koreensis]|uniref:beta strand repeat-containing protein n=1 Tax=Dokdonella koreensis TaxID=323415 RepID=UPI000A6E6D4E|nr:choice-of-anchor D domain-containing protein [Dokdonella koreensis]
MKRYLLSRAQRARSSWLWPHAAWLSIALIGALAAPATAFAEKSFAVEPAATPVVRAFWSDAGSPPASRPATAPRGGPTSYSNATAITITDCPNPCPASGQAASLYPSPITVAGETGVIERVSVTLNGFSHAFPADVDILLVSPSGRKVVLMSDFGAGSPGVSNINVTLDDYAERPVPSTVTGNTGVPFVTGTYRPANSGTTDLFPAPAPAAPYTYTLSAFNGDNPNGTWNLYIIDDANLDGGTISGGWTLTFDARPAPPAAGDILISEFRTRGAGTTPPGSDGSADEFIELYNNTDQSITIIDAVPGADPTSPSGAGWRIAGAQGAAETTFLVLPQTLSTAGPLALAPRSYFLISTQPTAPSPAGNTYSLSTYPTGTGITASGSANVSVNPASATVGFLPDDVGLAVFSTSAATSANRLDAVGYSSVTLADYKEGTGLAPAAGITAAGQHSWVRKTEPSGTGPNFPQDTGDNAADFILVEPTGGTFSGVAAILGAPGPQRGHTMTAFTTTAAPMHSADTMTAAVIDPGQPADAEPNLVRDLTPVTNGANGTLKIRRTYTNQSGKPLTAFRYRIIALSTLTGATPPAGVLDLRALNSPTQTITLTDTTTVTAQALTLQTPAAQALGGGVNSSLAMGVITTTAPWPNGASRSVEFNFGVNTAGDLPYAITIIAEGLPNDGIGGASTVDTFGILDADLAITKTDGVTDAVPGTAVTYSIVASNLGPGNDTAAAVTDTFPAQCASVAYTATGAGGAAGFTAAGSGNIADTLDLPNGASVTYTAVCAIDPAATGSLSNTATIAGSSDPNAANDSATDTDTLTAQADLAITNTDGVASVVAGGSTTYTLVASNAGPSHAPGSTVTDTFPAGCASVTWTCTGAGGGTCTAGGSGNLSDTVNLPAGGSVTYTAVCTVSPAATGTLSNVATVAAAAGVTDPVPANNSQTDTTTVLQPAALTLAPTTLAFGTVPVGTTSAPLSVTLSNSGDVSLQVTAVTAASAPFAQSGGTCGAPPITIAGGASCTIGYTFAPAAAGPASQTLTVTADAPGGGSITLSGTGTQGSLTVTPGSLDFGSVAVGSTSPVQSVTLGNSGGAPLQVTALSAAAAPFAQSGGTCGAVPITIAAGASCTVGYTFAPTTAGPASQTLTVTANVPGGGSIMLSGTGTQGSLTLAPASLDFGPVAIGSTSPVQSVTLGNSGGAPLQVTALGAAAAPFAQSGGTCGALPITIAAGASCTVGYTFAPAAAGPASQTLTVTANVPGGGSITLSGTGVAGVLGVLNATLDFGELNVGDSSTRTLTVVNTGSGPLTVTGLSPAAAPFSQLPGGTCGAVPFPLDADESCTVIYAFAPGSPGTYSQTITVTADVGSVNVVLTGQARAPAAVVVPVPVGGWSTLVLLTLMGLASLVVLRQRT